MKKLLEVASGIGKKVVSVVVSVSFLGTTVTYGTVAINQRGGSLVEMNQTMKGFTVSVYNANDNTTLKLVGGKHWKVTYKGIDGGEITMTEYKYDTAGRLSQVKDCTTDTWTVYDTNNQALRDVKLVRTYTDASTYTEEQITTAFYKYDTQGNMSSKQIVGYIGTDYQATGVIDINNNLNEDAGYAIVQEVFFKDGKKDYVKSYWGQENNIDNKDIDNDGRVTNGKWVKGTGSIVSVYLYEGNSMKAVASGSNLINNGGIITGVTSLSVYENGKEKSTFKITANSNTDGADDVKVALNAGNVKIGGQSITLTNGGHDVVKNGDTVIASETSEIVYSGIKKDRQLSYDNIDDSRAATIANGDIPAAAAVTDYSFGKATTITFFDDHARQSQIKTGHYTESGNFTNDSVQTVYYNDRSDPVVAEYKLSNTYDVDSHNKSITMQSAVKQYSVTTDSNGVHKIRIGDTNITLANTTSLTTDEQTAIRNALGGTSASITISDTGSNVKVNIGRQTSLSLVFNNAGGIDCTNTDNDNIANVKTALVATPGSGVTASDIIALSMKNGKLVVEKVLASPADYAVANNGAITIGNTNITLSYVSGSNNTTLDSTTIDSIKNALGSAYSDATVTVVEGKVLITPVASDHTITTSGGSNTITIGRNSSSITLTYNSGTSTLIDAVKESIRNTLGNSYTGAAVSVADGKVTVTPPTVTYSQNTQIVIPEATGRAPGGTVPLAYVAGTTNLTDGTIANIKTAMGITDANITVSVVVKDGTLTVTQKQSVGTTDGYTTTAQNYFMTIGNNKIELGTSEPSSDITNTYGSAIKTALLGTGTAGSINTVSAANGKVSVTATDRVTYNAGAAMYIEGDGTITYYDPNGGEKATIDTNVNP